MKAVAGELPDDPEAWAFEFKWDGMRALAFVDPGSVRLQSANLRDVTVGFPELAGLARLGVPTVLDGELVAFGEQGIPDFGRLQRRMHVQSPAEAVRRAAEVPVVYVVFDLLHLDGYDTMHLPFDDRRRLLEEVLLEGGAWRVTGSHPGDGAAMLDAAKASGLEGVVAKRRDSRYLPGIRSRNWRKVKVRHRQEFIVGGWTEGAGGRSRAIGSLLVGGHDDTGRLRFVGAVGSGLTDADLSRLWDRFTGLESDECPFDPPPPRLPRPVHWVRPEVVVETAFAEWTTDGRLRHPSYLGERRDKSPDEVTLDE